MKKLLLLVIISINIYASCEDGHWINEVLESGSIIILEDNSVWKVNSVDTIDSSLWLPMTNIVACEDKLINTDDGEVVKAYKIR